MHIQDARLSMSEISSRRGWLVRGGDGVEEGESGRGATQQDGELSPPRSTYILHLHFDFIFDFIFDSIRLITSALLQDIAQHAAPHSAQTWTIWRIPRWRYWQAAARDGDLEVVDDAQMRAHACAIW